MAVYRPDRKLQKAKRLIDNLDDSRENELIKYYIQEKQKLIDRQSERLKEYGEFFRTLNRFLPKKQVLG